MLVKNVEFFSGKTAEAPSMGVAAKLQGSLRQRLLRMSDNHSCLWEEVLAEGIFWVRSGALVLRATAESGAGVRGIQNHCWAGFGGPAAAAGTPESGTESRALCPELGPG